MNVGEGEIWDGNSKEKWSAVPASLSQLQKAEVVQEKTEEEKIRILFRILFFFFLTSEQELFFIELYIRKYLRTMKSLCQILTTAKRKKKRKKK